MGVFLIPTDLNSLALDWQSIRKNLHMRPLEVQLERGQPQALLTNEITLRKGKENSNRKRIEETFRARCIFGARPLVMNATLLPNASKP